MKILVIEDSAAHRQSAIQTLIGHDVTIVDSFDAAKELLQKSCWKDGAEIENQMFDAVLTDMMMPMSKDGLAYGTYKPEEQVPYGLILALQAAYRGAKFVAMLTDTNHHNGAMSKALDLLGPAYYDSSDGDSNVATKVKRFEINGAKVVFVHTPFTQTVEKGAVCSRCSSNPGVCANCNGTGMNKNPNWRPLECHSCSHTSDVGKCTNCKGTGRYDRAHKQPTKDWGRVLNFLLTGQDAPTFLEYDVEKNRSEEE